MLQTLLTYIQEGGLRNLVDIGLVAFILYRLFLIIRGTQALRILAGIGVLAVLGLLSKIFNLILLGWLYDHASTIILIGVIVLFQPELRRALEQVGRTGVLGELGWAHAASIGRTVDEVLRAVADLRSRRLGALIVFERETGLDDYAQTGIRLDAAVSAEVLEAVFYRDAPLHDGAVIIKAERLVAAGCFLPLAEATGFSERLGTRHRAALGLTLQTDAVVLVVSEQTGSLSLVTDGRIARNLDEAKLRAVLLQLLAGEPAPRPRYPWRRARAAA